MSANTSRLLFTTQNREVAGNHVSGFSLVPELVLGSTVSSINALSAAVDTNAFAFCAGPAVILAVVNTRLGLDQRLFCAKADTLPSQATPSYYNPATPTKATANHGYISSLSKDETTPGNVSLAPTDQNADSPSRFKSAHRSRSLTSVALSPSGKFLAVGETGYRPRILVFSTAPHAPTDTPLACLTEHTFGVRAVTFSHDSRWLCSLGDLHDGGFFLWSVNPKTGALRLNSSNRCTTADTIAWMGTSVVSIGTRHVKIWRLEQPSSPSKGRRGFDNLGDRSTASPVPRTFAGRNCLLGPLKDATFTCVAGISDDRAVLCTQDGVVCLLNDANRTQRLYQVSRKDYCITCITVDRSSGTVWLGGQGVDPEALPLDVLLAVEDPSAVPQEEKKLDEHGQHKKENVPGALTICCIGNRLIAVDSSRTIRIYDVGSSPSDKSKASVVQELPAHDSPVLGAVILSKPTETQSDFLTYSERGHIFHWLWNGTCTSRCQVHLDHHMAYDLEEPNELRAVRATPMDGMLLAGDKAGLVHLLNPSGEAQAVAKAHDGEVYDLALHELDGDGSLAASCGRDRTIQIFRISKEDCSLQQSLINEHAGPIRKLEFAGNGCILASMSPDRTIVIHQKILRSDTSIAFVSTKVISLTATPLTMSMLPGATPSLLVSATDRYLRKVSIAEGHVTHTIKTIEHANSEPVVLSRLSVGNVTQDSTGPSVIAGFSSADRSIRLYDVETGSLLAMEFGHTAVSDLALAKATGPQGERVSKIVSTGLDGTIMVWSILTPSQKNEFGHDTGGGCNGSDPSRLLPPSAPRPLRRVLSRTEIARYQRSLEKSEGDAPNPPRNLSPSRLRRKTSKFAISDTAEVADRSKTVRSSHTSAGAYFHRSKIKHASPPLSPRTSLQSRSRRSSLDERYRDMASHRNRNINTTAKQLLGIIQDFRKQLTVSKESLSIDTTQALQKELHSTLNSLSQRTRRNDPDNEETGNESFDDFLARMIDDRLALRFKPEEQANTTEGGRNTDPPPASEAANEGLQ